MAELRAVCEDQKRRIGVLEGEMVKYLALKRDYVSVRVMSRWFDLWSGFIRTAFVSWKNFRDAAIREDSARMTMRRAILRRTRHMEHRGFQKWRLVARERTDKLKGSCVAVQHALARMRSFYLVLGFRKWIEASRKAEAAEGAVKAERKLVATKASQALKMLERSVLSSSDILN